MALSSDAQDAGGELETALRNYFAAYRISGFRPKLEIGLERFDVDDARRVLQVYGNEGFASQMFTPEIVKNIYRDLPARLPQPYNAYRLIVYGFGHEISTLIPNIYRDRQDENRLWGNIDYNGAPWTRNVSRPYTIGRGLQNRHITVWASHGRYYDFGLRRWKWQRPFLFCTTEDLFTQSFVTPFLIPMLQNSGAVVYTPRERDWQTHEVIVDNDRSDSDSYKEKSNKGEWKPAPVAGFAQRKDTYVSGENPFTDGTARMADATKNRTKAASCFWIPNIPQAGKYAVYVSYPTLANSVSDARYTVRHRGVATRFRVNQQMGGNTWVYLGTFDFAQGRSFDNCVTLSNVSDFRGVVTADAVRFGGGMGNVMRGDNDDEMTTSGMPRFLEGARYSVQMGGFPDSVYDTKDGRNDYADDINSRSLSLNYLSGGSVYHPDSVGSKVPFELSLAVHSDAGVAGDNSVFGTLCVSTLNNGHDDTFFSSGVSRLASSDLAALLQNSVCQDLSRVLGLPWTRRELFNRNYSETRIPEVPSAIVEMLSHQNFTDMRFGHDPVFKFLMARSIYKGVLKYIANQHHTEYVVQPLPVKHFSVSLTPDGNASLSWAAQPDSLESTARPDGYVVYTRRDGADYDNGTVVRDTKCEIPLESDVVYSFKVTAFNDGGESFPSEELSAMRAAAGKGEILIVNGFERLSSPAVVNTPDSLGFDLNADIGVPYMATPEYCGAQINFNPLAAGAAGTGGLGYSGSELQGQIVGGNTFDYPYVHGKAIESAKGYSFCSCSASAVDEGLVDISKYKIIDLIFGLQKDDGAGSILYYKTFRPTMQLALRRFFNKGGRLFVSGAYIASDMTSPDDNRFVSELLHYTRTDATAQVTDSILSGSSLKLTFQRSYSGGCYAVKHPDRLVPTGKAFTAFTYSDGSSAGVAYDGNDYKVLALGIPFESVTSEGERNELMQAALELLTR